MSTGQDQAWVDGLDGDRDAEVLSEVFPTCHLPGIAGHSDPGWGRVGRTVSG